MNNSTHRPYRVDASQKEKAEILRNDARANTMHGRASADLDLENTGRFAKPRAVIGDGAPDYPRLPENSWTNDPVPPEPALGVPIDAHEPVGESWEVEASLGEAVPPSAALAQGDANTQASVATQSELASPNHLVDLAGAMAAASVVDPLLTGVDEAPTRGTSASVVEPPANPKPKTKLRGL